MTEKEQIRREVTQLVADVAELSVEQISPEATLAELEIDSLDSLRIVAEVEKRYGVHIADEVVAKIRTMAQIFALVDAHEPHG